MYAGKVLKPRELEHPVNYKSTSINLFRLVQMFHKNNGMDITSLWQK
jgi:hypothetical protein